MLHVSLQKLYQNEDMHVHYQDKGIHCRSYLDVCFCVSFSVIDSSGCASGFSSSVDCFNLAPW